MSVVGFKSDDCGKSCRPGRQGQRGPAGVAGSTGPTGATGVPGTAVGTGATGPTGQGVGAGTLGELAFYNTASTITSGGPGFNIIPSGTAGANYIGIGSGLIGVEADSIAIGTDTEASAAGSIVIGHGSQAKSGADNTIIIGSNSPNTNISGADNICIGQGAGGPGGVGLSGEYNICIGSDAGSQMTGANENVCVGKWTLQDIVNSHFNVCIGAEAGRVITGANNTCLGMNAGPTTVAGSGNVFLGSSAGIAAHGISSADNSKLVIANGPAAANRLLFGDFATPNVGISTSLPATATNLDIADSGATNKPGQTFKRVSATIGTDDALGTINFSGTAAAGGGGGVDSAAPRVGASIQGCAAETWTTGANNSGSDLRFSTTMNGGGGAGAFYEMMRISNNGNVGIFPGATTPINPADPNILQIRHTNSDVNLMVDITGSAAANQIASLTLGNFNTLGSAPANTTRASSEPIGSIKVQGWDATVEKNLSQMNTLLTDESASAFTSNVEFSMMSAGDEVKCMEMRGSDTTTGSLGGNFGNGLLCRTYTKMVGNGTYELSDADSGMHIWASTALGFVTFYLPGNTLNTAFPATPLAGTHYRFICNANGSFPIHIESSDGTGHNLKMFGVVAHGGAQVLPTLPFTHSPYNDYAVGIAPAPNTGGLSGNDGISLGNSTESIYSVVGDYIDVMFNGLTWHVNGTCAGTQCDGCGFVVFSRFHWYNNCMALG